MKRFTIAFALSGFLLSCAQAQMPVRVRTDIPFPDIEGFVTLKCDFHIHTVFSDGLVWPSVRSEEAWREGLDAIAITDHIEYQPHKSDMIKNHNRPYEIADALGKDLNLLVVHGSEITRSMPPGHINAIFLTNSASLETPKWQDAVGAAHQQGAFIFWNHPGWENQITNGNVIWYPDHTALLESGQLHGIEIVNERDYYPEAHRWAIEKKLTMLSNSDVHEPVNLFYHVHAGDHRPMTLVFARERSMAALKEALFARRTAVYSGNRLIGEEQFLRPIFEKSIKLDRSSVTFTGRKSSLVQISNRSPMDFHLESSRALAGVAIPKKITLPAGKTVLFEVRSTGNGRFEGMQPDYNVSNLLIAPDKPLTITLPLKLTSQAPGR